MKITDLKSISREETKSLAQNMTLTNHEAFAKVFSKEECVKELVEVLMDEKITLVESKVEWRLMNEGYRGVVLDLCCILKDGRMVDVEIQNYNEKDIQLRSRYHIACMDTHQLEKNTGFHELKDKYIYWLVTKDYYGLKQMVYHFFGRSKEHSKMIVSDGVHIFIMNIKAIKEIKTPLEIYLNYFSSGKGLLIENSMIAKTLEKVKGDDRMFEALDALWNEKNSDAVLLINQKDNVIIQQKEKINVLENLIINKIKELLNSNNTKQEIRAYYKEMDDDMFEKYYQMASN